MHNDKNDNRKIVPDLNVNLLIILLKNWRIIQNENLKNVNRRYSKCRPMSNNHAYKIEK